MTWHIFVTRNDRPAVRGGGIELSEWCDFVARDPDLALLRSGTTEVTTTAIWRGAPGTDVIWEEGTIRVCGPADPVICKLWEIATALGGHIEDDDGGRYDRNGIYLGNDLDALLA